MNESHQVKLATSSFNIMHCSVLPRPSSILGPSSSLRPKRTVMKLSPLSQTRDWCARHQGTVHTATSLPLGRSRFPLSHNQSIVAAGWALSAILRQFDSKGANVDSSPCQAQRQLAAVGPAVIVEEPEPVIIGLIECPCRLKCFLQTSECRCMLAVSAGVQDVLDGQPCAML